MGGARFSSCCGTPGFLPSASSTFCCCAFPAPQVPESLDVLLVEQEIVGSEKSALEAVVAADMELVALREEEAEINRWAWALACTACTACTALGCNFWSCWLVRGAVRCPHCLPVSITCLLAVPACRKLGHLDLNGADGNGDAEQRAAAHAEQQQAAAAAAGGEDDGDMAARLTEIYERMAEIGAASAESRASKILHGLGFTEAMQVGGAGWVVAGWLCG